jgi:hypothetical protein
MSSTTPTPLVPLTTGEFATLVFVSPRATLAWAQAGKVVPPAVKVDRLGEGHRWRFWVLEADAARVPVRGRRKKKPAARTEASVTGVTV